MATAWRTGAIRAQQLAKSSKLNVSWLRVDWVCSAEKATWRELKNRLKATKRNYFRYGIALDPEFKIAFLEQELNANAMLYGGNQVEQAVVNEKNFAIYASSRCGNNLELDFSDEKTVYILSTGGAFCDESANPVLLHESGRNAGRRIIEELDEETVTKLIDQSSRYLSTQVKQNGEFYYGWHPSFDRGIAAYNTLRHASTTYSMLEAWEVTRDSKLKSAIGRSLNYLTQKLIRRLTLNTGEQAAFLVEANGEIKLGGNAVCLLALVKYAELTGTQETLPLLEQLAAGIQFMQNKDTGSFVHVLQYPELTVKETFRIIYYDGEAAFGLMRLYGLTGNPRWLAMVEKAFGYFISADHWKAHDHWLSYCVNELTLYRPEERYYQFGIRNVAGYLDFIENRITTFPTLLELMMAAEKMVVRLRQDAHYQHLLSQLDLPRFYRALHIRAHYLLNGHFWPEYAMYFKNPRKIVGSFFIRHHAFRVRIDDVEHYLSGFVAYRKFLLRESQAAGIEATAVVSLLPVPAPSEAPAVAWGGDVNLGRRQHYRTAELGETEVLGRIPALNDADLSIVNLECVVATSGEQGVEKGEKSPYYYRARPEMLRLLVSAHIDVVTTANNHSGDYGPEALLEQTQWLDALGIGHCGTGADREQALAPVFRPAGAFNVAIFSLDATQRHFAASGDKPGCAHLPLANPEEWRTLLAPRIAAARERAHIVLVAVHWGENLEREPGEAEIEVGHAIIDAGADAVLGTSAHLLQGIEIYRERPIIHDAGDLLFDSVRQTLADSGIFRLELSDNGVQRIRFVPVGVGFGFSRQLHGHRAVEASRRFGDQCAKLGTSLSLLQDGSCLIELSPPARAPLRCDALPKPAYDLATLQQLSPAEKPAWSVAEIPADAHITPIRLGDLALVGVRVHPREIQSRQILWVESFWMAGAPIAEDLRIDFRAVPTQPSRMPYWGKSMDHDPCDWQVPTSRWQPGRIYRDFYGLRPPAAKSLQNGELQLQVGLVSSSRRIAPVPLPGFIVSLKIPEKANGQPSRPLPVYRTEFPPLSREYNPGQTWNAEQLQAITGGTWLVPPPQGWYVRSVLSGKGFIEHAAAPAMFVAHTNLDRAYHERSSSIPAQGWDLHSRLPKLAGEIAGAIVARAVPDLPPGFPVLKVDDPIHAIIELGLAARSRFDKDVIAVTGTAGKSSTLKMLSHMLGGRERVLASIGNYNSRVGAPSMLASLSPDHDAAVVEVAQSALWMKRGPITRLIKPTISVITEIGVSQTDGNVRTVLDTAHWKSRIFDGLTGASVAIIGEHLQCFEYIREKARKHAKRVIVFGTSSEAEVQILNIEGDESGSRVVLRTPEQQVSLYVPVPSLGMVHNAVASLCALYAMGRDLTAGANSLQNIELEEGRLRRAEVALSGHSVSVIDDSWNATISSMLNAFSVLAQTKAGDGGRKVAVLGRIVHLGDQSQALHESLAEPLMASGVDLVVTHGEEMQHLRVMLPEAVLGPHFSAATELIRYLEKSTRQSDLILIKGSRRDSDFGSIAKLLNEIAKEKSSYA